MYVTQLSGPTKTPNESAASLLSPELVVSVRIRVGTVSGNIIVNDYGNPLLRMRE